MWGALGRRCKSAGNLNLPTYDTQSQHHDYQDAEVSSEV